MLAKRRSEGKPPRDEAFLQLKKTIEEIKLVLRCGICYSTLSDGILTTCNHAFCKTCHTQCFQALKNLRCPICNQMVNKRSCQPCPSLTNVTKQYLNLASCFKADCTALSLPKEMQFYESQAVCDATSRVMNSAYPSSSNVQSPVFLVPQFAPRRKRPRLIKDGQSNETVKPIASTSHALPVFKSKTTLETISEVAETVCSSTQTSFENALSRGRFAEVASQCDALDIAAELKSAVSALQDKGNMSPTEALVSCLPWIPDFLGLTLEGFHDVVKNGATPHDNTSASCSKGVQTDGESFSCVKQETAKFVEPRQYFIRPSQRRDSIIDVTGISDREGKEETDSDATCPMYIDERSGISELDHVEQSDKENNTALKEYDSKNIPPLNASPKQDFFSIDENARNGFEEGNENAIISEEVVGDSLQDSPSEAQAGTSLQGMPKDAKSEELSDPSHVGYKYKLMVSGSLQSDYLAVVQSFFESFNQATLWKDFDDECTHLVILNSEGRRCAKRSIKYAWAIAKSIPVLCRAWLEDSVAEKTIMPIDDYEIVGDLYYDPESHSSLRSRQEPKSLFAGLTFCLPPTYFKDSHVPRDLLMKMIAEAGGECVQNIWDIHYPKDPIKCYIIFGAGCRDRDAAKRFEEDLKISVLMAEWILDCLTQLFLFDIRTYKISSF